MKYTHCVFFLGLLLKVLFFCGVVFASTGEVSPTCKSIGSCQGVFGESTAKDIYALCESLMNQDICKDVPEEYRFQCGRPNPHTHHPTPSFPETSSFPGKSSFPRKRESTSHSQSNATSLDSRLHGKVHKTLSLPEASSFPKTSLEATLGGFQLPRKRESTPTNPLAFFKSCGVGLYEGGADILSFLWGVMKYALHPPAALRGMARGLESEAAQSAKLYLAGEYEKALEEAKGPVRSLQALGSVSGGVFGKLFDAIYGFLYREVEEFKCMNMAGRMNTICYLAVDFLIPPAAAIAFLKGGKVPGKVAEFVDQSKKVSSSPQPKVLSRVKVPRAFETESGLRAKGFREAYIVGMDEMHRMEAIADALRRNRVDPNVTHIEDFADQVEDHIAFFKRSGAEEAIEELAQAARLKVKEGKITYNWWMKWNAEMVEKIEGRPIGEAIYKGQDGVTKMKSGGFRANPFGSDEVIYLPTTKELGVMAFNQSSSKNLIPLGLVNQTVYVDGLIYEPVGFLKHDFVHGTSKLVNNEGYKYFHKSFRKKVKHLPKNMREKVELVLFMRTHERPLDVESVSQIINVPFKPFERNRFLRENDLDQYLPSALKDTRSRLSYKDYKRSVVRYYKSAENEFQIIARMIQLEEGFKKPARKIKRLVKGH